MGDAPVAGVWPTDHTTMAGHELDHLRLHFDKRGKGIARPAS
jgi:hypothetical protein